MAKKARKAKVKKITVPPSFGINQHIGNNHVSFMVADANGVVWCFDLDSCEARPVIFKA